MYMGLKAVGIHHWLGVKGSCEGPCYEARGLPPYVGLLPASSCNMVFLHLAANRIPTTCHGP